MIAGRLASRDMNGLTGAGARTWTRAFMTAKWLQSLASRGSIPACRRQPAKRAANRGQGQHPMSWQFWVKSAPVPTAALVWVACCCYVVLSSKFVTSLDASSHHPKLPPRRVDDGSPSSESAWQSPALEGLSAPPEKSWPANVMVMAVKGHGPSSTCPMGLSVSSHLAIL